MKKLFTILAMVLATIIISSCSESAPTQPIEEEDSFTISLYYYNTHNAPLILYTFVYDDKGVFQEMLYAGRMKGWGEVITQSYHGKKNWVLKFGLSEKLPAKSPSDLIKVYTIVIKEQTHFEIKY